MSDQRERILACACDLYLEEGLDGFSMRKLARAVGVTAPAIYRHYDGREAVLADVLREAHRTFSRYLYAALSAPTPLERFSAASDGFLNFVVDHPRWYEMMHTSIEHLGMEALPEDLDSMKASIHHFWNDRVRECMQAGILKDADPAEISVTMWAHAHGMVQLYHQGCFGSDAEQFRTLFEASGVRLLAGVATEAFERELDARKMEHAAHAPA